MNLYIPSIGDQIQLTAAWQFKLHAERRNSEAFRCFGHKHDGWRDTRDASEYVEAKLPAGTVLTVDRIYIRKGKADFDSITFYAKLAVPKTLVIFEDETTGKKQTMKFKAIRFWVKLEDANRIEFMKVL